MEQVAGYSLYFYPSCGYCRMVRQVIDQLGAEVELRDIHQGSQHLQDLVAATGRQTVPCLRVENEAGESRWIHESRDIISYLSEQFAG
ncbi:MAG: glutathione S-transferase N-terminal domain-containing protein [Myxococcota bacterium]|nr:glutathione S-transferase N-terminal domain-containing protein [Myxococcota bacterium]